MLVFRVVRNLGLHGSGVGERGERVWQGSCLSRDTPSTRERLDGKGLVGGEKQGGGVFCEGRDCSLD